jgi:hypothetical protein
LEEKRGLAEEQGQGRRREKVAVVAVRTPDPQAPQSGQPLRGSERHGGRLRRGALREAPRRTTSAQRQTLPPRERDRGYLHVEGQRCPTREPRQGADAQGSRAAKAVRAFSQAAGAAGSKERPASRHKILRAQSTERETLHAIFTAVSQQARGAAAAEVLVLADGARWLWAMGEDLVPHASQLLDFRPAQH